MPGNVEFDYSCLFREGHSMNQVNIVIHMLIVSYGTKLIFFSYKFEYIYIEPILYGRL